MRQAKERKRMDAAECAEECGNIQFSGQMFGGPHSIRCLVSGENTILLEIDGAPYKPTTYRGLCRLLARRLSSSPNP